MVDPIGVGLLERVVDDLVQMLGGGEVGAEGFLDDDARPATGLRLVEPGVFQVDEDFIEELGGGGDVEKPVALAAVLGVDGVELLREAAVAVGIGEFRGVIGNGLDEAVPDLLVMAGAGNLAVQLFKSGAEFRVGFFPAGETDDFHPGRQLAIDC